MLPLPYVKIVEWPDGVKAMVVVDSTVGDKLGVWARIFIKATPKASFDHVTSRDQNSLSYDRTLLGAEKRATYDIGGFGNKSRRWMVKRSFNGSEQWNAGESPGTLNLPAFLTSNVRVV